MIIFCFGCSFTGGVYDRQELRESWPYRLSLLLPEHKIYNFGKQATSALYSINMIEQATSQLSPDLILTQLTVPTRMTFYDTDFRFDYKNHVVQLTDNYFVLKSNIDQIHPINAVMGKKQLKEISLNSDSYEKYKIFEKLITMQDDYNHFDPEYRSFFSRAAQLSDFVFFHRKTFREIPGLENTPCVEKDLGTEEFLKLVIDKGFHFGQPGAEWIANWILKKLKL
jgi:lysophospholipase L1-like esterase